MKLAIVYSSFYGKHEEELLENSLSFFLRTENTQVADSIKNAIEHMKSNYFLANALPENFNSVYSQVSIAKVSGAMEIPQALNWMTIRGFSGILTLGCVIQGKTSHYDHVCEVAMKGIAKIALKSGIPVSNGIVTSYNEADALERISAAGKNLGLKSMENLHNMIQLKNKLGYDRP